MENKADHPYLGMKEKPKHPYCTINGKIYQLEYVNDVIRFPNIKEDCSDLNKLHADYFSGKISIIDLFEEYATTGSSYYLVTGKFQPYNINSHTCKSGDHLEMLLYSGDPDIDGQYNYTKSEMVLLGIIEELQENIEEGILHNLKSDELVKLFESYIEKIKEI